MEAQVNDKKARKVRNARHLDEVDYHILRILQSNSPLTDKQMSIELEKKVSLQATACGKRVKFLEKNGYIKSCKYILDAEKLGSSYLCFMYAKVPDKSKDEEFCELMKSDSRVLELHSLFGSEDYIMKVRVRDKKEAIDMSRSISSQGFPVTTTEVVETMKETTEIRLPEFS